jgi:rhodanese-related sulfurtransferase
MIVKPALLFVALALACQTVQAQSFADENKDWAVPPRSTAKGPPYTADTPLVAPGVKTIMTSELKSKIRENPKLRVIDVLGEKQMLPGALSMAGVGIGTLNGALAGKFGKVLSTLSSNDKALPLVFYCHHSRCWWSYNASLHALAAGYTNVYWYRGGIDAWTASGAPTVATQYAPGWNE